MLIDFDPDHMLYPFESRWFESSAGRVHYVDEGAGRPIVFFHGSPTWSFLYRRIMLALRGEFRCIAMDYPGFGLSERPDGYGYTIGELTTIAGELVDHLGLDGFVTMGHDWGGPIGLGVATERAERTAGVALANTIFWPKLPLANNAFSRVMSSGPMQRRILQRNLLVEKFLLGPAGPELSEPEADHYRLAQPCAPARAGLAEMPGQIRGARPLLAQLEHDVPHLLGDKPAVAIWGMRDLVFRPRDCLPRLRAAFADLGVVELPDAGHFVPEDAPAEVAAAITERFGSQKVE
ncbi:alpha/beta fold hydrolase [Gordonia caeni]|uniref:Haloalkane dehalogenase n=1 Tax=Gordonia caeni TaxID=1007097 RepID=A0ABP7NXZ0_9ACTN